VTPMATANSASEIFACSRSSIALRC
jgi:hypothetical protein